MYGCSAARCLETDATGGMLSDDIYASRNDTAETYSDPFDGRDDNEIMETLMKQHATRDISVV